MAKKKERTLTGGILHYEQKMVEEQFKVLQEKLKEDANGSAGNAESKMDGVRALLKSEKNSKLYTILLAHIRGVPLEENIANINSILASDMHTLEILSNPVYKKLGTPSESTEYSNRRAEKNMGTP